MKICVLEICPNEPSKHHLEMFEKSDLVDFYYVSYKKKGKDCIQFNKNKSWAHNRNSLYDHTKGKYDFYFFIDYDIVLSCKNGNNPLQHIIEQLKRLSPKMYRPHGFNTEHSIKSGISVGGFINHSVTIFDQEAANIVFNLPTSFGGFWDAASYINTVLVPVFENQVFVDFDVFAENTESSGYIQNKIPFIGKRAMQKLFKLTQKHFESKNKKFNSVTEMRTFYDRRRFVLSDTSTKLSLSTNNISDFININTLKKELNV